MLALRVHVVGSSGKTVEDVADTVGDGANNATSDAVDDALDI